MTLMKGGTLLLHNFIIYKSIRIFLELASNLILLYSKEKIHPLWTEN